MPVSILFIVSLWRVTVYRLRAGQYIVHSQPCGVRVTVYRLHAGQYIVHSQPVACHSV